jgi:hypothetical protein
MQSLALQVQDGLKSDRICVSGKIMRLCSEDDVTTDRAGQAAIAAAPACARKRGYERDDREDEIADDGI